MKTLHIYLDDEDHARFKAECLKVKRSMAGVLVDFVMSYGAGVPAETSPDFFSDDAVFVEEVEAVTKPVRSDFGINPDKTYLVSGKKCLGVDAIEMVRLGVVKRDDVKD